MGGNFPSVPSFRPQFPFQFPLFPQPGQNTESGLLSIHYSAVVSKLRCPLLLARDVSACIGFSFAQLLRELLLLELWESGNPASFAGFPSVASFPQLSGVPVFFSRSWLGKNPTRCGP